MKSLVALSVLLLANCIFASPLVRSDDVELPLREFQENVIVDDPKYRWANVPDGDGRMHLIDLNLNHDDVEPFFNAANDVLLILYTARNPTSGIRLFNDVNQVRNSQWNAGASVRFIIHGWNNDGTSTVNTVIRSAYLSRGDFNVVVVDWGAGANTIDYVAARNRINSVADVTASFINMLLTNGLTTRARVSIIGHSLGGQTAGLIGKRVSGGRVQTVVGLDPAGPLFSTNQPDQRINIGDANYVEIIHTNGWTLGFGEPLGNADFFPNGGREQPGCGIDLTGACSHGRAPTFFAESVRNNRFVANRCASFQEVDNNRCTIQSSGYKMGGEPPNNGLSGYYHLITNSNSPYGRG